MNAVLFSLLHASSTLFGSSGNVIQMEADEVYRGFTVLVYVEGVRVKAFVNLTRKESFISEQLLGTERDTSSVRVELMGQKPKSIEVVPISNPGVSVILGRSFFKGMIIRWDIPRAELHILDNLVETSDGRSISFEEGWFAFGKHTVRLPKLSFAGEIPFGTNLESAYLLTDPTRVIPSPRESVQIVTNLYGALQVVVSPPKTSALDDDPSFERQFVPGASFFGATEVTFDFKKMKVYFKSSPEASHAHILGTRLALKLKAENGVLSVLGSYLKDSDQQLKQFGLVGASVITFADEPFDYAKLGDQGYIRQLLAKLKSKDVLEVSNGKSIFRLGD